MQFFCNLAEIAPGLAGDLEVDARNRKGDGRSAMNLADPEAVYRFEGFVLDLARGALLSAGGEEVPLRRKSFELLRLFVANAGRLLDRDTLNQAIWSNVIVTDDGVTQCVRDIRRALDDDAQRIIRTVPRRGYIFAATVTGASHQQEAPSGARHSLTAEPEPEERTTPVACGAAVSQQEWRSGARISRGRHNG